MNTNTIQQKLKDILGTAGDGKSVNMIPLYVLGGLILVTAIVVWGMMPRKGTVYYGACKTYVELHMHFPHTMEILNVVERGPEVRIQYNQIDAYGQFTFNEVVCKFKSNDQGNIVLDSVNLNRGTQYPMEKDNKIAQFNEVIDIVLKKPPDLTLPPPMPQNIENFR